MRRSISAAIIGALSLLVVACSGGGTSPMPSSPAAPAQPYSGPPQLAAFQWGQQVLKQAQYAGPADFVAAGVDVAVTMQDQAGLLRYAQDVSDPASPQYRHFLTPQEIARRFGATASDYQAAAKYFQSYGLHVAGWPQREMLYVSGLRPQLEAAFGTKFGIYHLGSATFTAPSGTPHFTAALPVTAVTNLVQLPLVHGDVIRGPASNSTRGYTPQQIARIFDFQGAYDAGFNGSGINVAIVGTGPISQEDAPFLGKLYHASIGTIKQMPVNDQSVAQALSGQPLPTPLPSGSPVPAYPYSTGLQSPPPVTAPCTGKLPACNPEDFEAQIDTQSVASLAPGATTLFYLAYNPNECLAGKGPPSPLKPCPAGHGAPAEGLFLSDPETQQIIADNIADAVSMSFSGGEPLQFGFFYNSEGQGFGPVEFATLVSEGIALFASSGDNGPFDCNPFINTQQKCAAYPAGDPSVVSVGGVNASFNDNTGRAPLLTSWGSATQEGGDGTFSNNIGSGGGISQVFSAPPWQQHLVIANGSGTLTSATRVQPDVSLDGDPATGPSYVLNVPFGVQVAQFGGTSVSAPEMAAMWALVLQACKQTASCATATGPHPYRLGNPAPLFYAIYAKGFTPSNFTPKLPYSSVFYDITYGDTSAFAPPSPSAPPSASPGPLLNGFQAGTGYDLVTGVGAPFGGHLIQAITGQAVP